MGPRIFYLGLVCLQAVGCSALNPHVVVTADRDATVRTAALGPTALKAGAPFEISNETWALVESPGFLPVLVVGNHAQTSEVNLHLKSVIDDAQYQSVWWAEVDRLVTGIQRVETLLREKKNQLALSATEDLLRSYPKVQNLHRLKATCLIVLGQREAAAALLKDIELNKPAPEGVKP